MNAPSTPKVPAIAPQVPAKRALIVGCGYLGTRVAVEAVAQGWEVWGTTRRIDRFGSLAGLGVRPLRIDWSDPRTLRQLPEIDRVLVSVSYDAREGRDRYDSQVGGLSRLLDAIDPQVPLCYISTTGVYHQTSGEWVDETSPTRPHREGGRVHLEAEELLRRRRPVGAGRSGPWTILRLAGIYGPGRVPRIADVIAARPIRTAERGYLNLIHVHDAARAVLSAWSRPPELPSRLYAVADDRPVVRGEFYREIARQCRVPPPEFLAPSPTESSRSEGNKRIWNRRFKRELVPRLAFPSYREGLADVISNGFSDRRSNV